MEVEWDRVMTYAGRLPIDDKIPIRKMDRIRNTKLYNPLTASRVSQCTHDDPLPGQSASVNSPRRERTSSNPYRRMLVYGSQDLLSNHRYSTSLVADLMLDQAPRSPRMKNSLQT